MAGVSKETSWHLPGDLEASARLWVTKGTSQQTAPRVGGVCSRLLAKGWRLLAGEGGQSVVSERVSGGQGVARGSWLCCPVEGTVSPGAEASSVLDAAPGAGAHSWHLLYLHQLSALPAALGWLKRAAR